MTYSVKHVEIMRFPQDLAASKPNVIQCSTFLVSLRCALDVSAFQFITVTSIKNNNTT